MKTTNWMTMFLLAGLFALASCGKPAPPPPVQKGVTIDMPKLQEAFANASAECQACIAETVNGVRYGELASALVALEKLANTPGLTEPQKKIVAQVTDQVKQVANKTPAPPR
jgi:hypothetical protein